MLDAAPPWWPWHWPASPPCSDARCPAMVGWHRPLFPMRSCAMARWYHVRLLTSAVRVEIPAQPAGKNEWLACPLSSNLPSRTTTTNPTHHHHHHHMQHEMTLVLRTSPDSDNPVIIRWPGK